MNLRIGKKSAHRKDWILIFVLFLLVLGVYYPSLDNQFVNLDDFHYIIINPYIQDLSWKGIYKIFSEPIVANYFPLQILSYALDYQIWRFHPFGYHLTNVLLHIFNTVMVFFLLRKIFSNSLASFLAALLFALHPVNVESVTWVAERKNVLSMAFLLSSFLTYLYYLEEPLSGRRKKFYLISLFLFLLALLAKVSAVVLPLLLLLYDFCFSRRGNWEMVRDKIPYGVLSLAFALIAVLAYHHQKILIGFHGGSPYHTALAMMNVLVEYLIYLVVPLFLDNYYLTPIPQSFFQPQVILSFSALALIILLAWFSFRRDRLLFFWSAWFLIALSPVLNIVPISILRADRYMYLPAIGFFYLLSHLLLKLGQRKPNQFHRFLSLLIIVGILGSYAYLTGKRNEVWKDTLSLWTDNLRKFPHHASAYCSIGNDFLGKGKIDLAITYFQSGLAIDPENLRLINGLSSAYQKKGNWSKGEHLLIKAVQINPNDSLTRLHLGCLYLEKKELEKAWVEIEKALALNPRSTGAYVNRGVIHHLRGQLDEAIRDYEKAVELSPDSILPYINLAISYEEKGLLNKAEECLKKGLEHFPKSHQGYFHLGRIYLNQKKGGAADFYLKEAWRLKPEDGPTNYLLGMLAQAEANFYFQRVNKTQSADPTKGFGQPSFEKFSNDRRADD